MWREPAEESTNLYPGLVVHDGRVSGSITVGRSRLPLWAFVHTAVAQGWDEVESGWEPGERYGYSAQQFAEFLYYLLEPRGEFARLLLVLADAERREQARDDRGDWRGWWEIRRQRMRVATQLRRCLRVLEEEANRG